MAGDAGLNAVGAFADAVMAKFAAPVAMWPEDQLKTPVEVLIKAVGGVVAPRKPITVITEAPRDADAEGEAAGASRVDMAVAVADALNGHVELKAPGKGADPTKFKGRDKEQWDRFRQYPNLIYTDGNEWARFETGSAAT